MRCHQQTFSVYDIEEPHIFLCFWLTFSILSKRVISELSDQAVSKEGLLLVARLGDLQTTSCTTHHVNLRKEIGRLSPSFLEDRRYRFGCRGGRVLQAWQSQNLVEAWTKKTPTTLSTTSRVHHRKRIQRTLCCCSAVFYRHIVVQYFLNLFVRLPQDGKIFTLPSCSRKWSNLRIPLPPSSSVVRDEDHSSTKRAIGTTIFYTWLSNKV